MLLIEKIKRILEKIGLLQPERIYLDDYTYIDKRGVLCLDTEKFYNSEEFENQIKRMSELEINIKKGNEY